MHNYYKREKKKKEKKDNFKQNTFRKCFASCLAKELAKVLEPSLQNSFFPLLIQANKLQVQLNIESSISVPPAYPLPVPPLDITE